MSGKIKLTKEQIKGLQLSQTIELLKEHDSNFEKHMQKLLYIAEHNNLTFKLLLVKLDTSV